MLQILKFDICYHCNHIETCIRVQWFNLNYFPKKFSSAIGMVILDIYKLQVVVDNEKWWNISANEHDITLKCNILIWLQQILKYLDVISIEVIGFGYNHLANYCTN